MCFGRAMGVESNYSMPREGFFFQPKQILLALNSDISCQLMKHTSLFLPVDLAFPPDFFSVKMVANAGQPCTVFTIPDAGHDAMLTRPKDLADKILEACG